MNIDDLTLGQLKEISKICGGANIAKKSAPVEIGRLVLVDGKPGIIAEDHGHHIGVNFDADKPGCVLPCHPTWHVEYGEMGKVRPMTKSQRRYRRWLEYGDGFHSFIDFCRWDAEPERSWNS